MSLPEPIIALLASFQPVFTTPTWQKALVLLVGTLLARGRRTVTVALRQMGLEETPHFSKSHHLLNRARWSPMQLSRCLLCLLVETFVQIGGTVEIVIDETLERRQGLHISKRGYYYDSVRSTHEHPHISSGLRWVCMTLIVTPPWTKRYWALPDFACPCHFCRDRCAAWTPTQDRTRTGRANGSRRASLAP